MVTIYGIQCVENGKTYVGCTKYKTSKRLREHRCLLRKKEHSALKMIEDWHRLGEDKFKLIEFELLPDGCSIAAKREAETRWMHHFKEKGLLYNENMCSFDSTPESRALSRIARAAMAPYHHTEETKERIRRGNSKPKNHGARVSAVHKANGHQPTRECIEKSVAVRKAKAQACRELKI